MTSPATPRDDIAGLSERLRHISRILEKARAGQVIMTVWSSDVEAVTEAATQLDAQAAEIASLRVAQAARVKELEGNLADAEATLFKLNSGEELQSLMRRNNELQARATRAEQQRDEAYERAAKVAEGPLFDGKYRGSPEHNWWHEKQPSVSGQNYGNGRHDAAAAIRQLAAGNEKEGE